MSSSQRSRWEGASLVVQWLRLCAPNAEGLGSIPSQGTRSRMPQLSKSLYATLGILQAATKTWNSQINKIFLFFIFPQLEPAAAKHDFF